MNYFSVDDLAKKDFLISLGIWLSLMLVAFVLFPTLKLIDPGDRLATWFYLSLPLGIGGALLLGGCSRYIALTHATKPKNQRVFRILLGQLLGWVGLAGIGFPMGMVIAEFLVSVMKTFAGQ